MKKKIIEAFKQPLLKKNLIDLLIGGILFILPGLNFISWGYLCEKLINGINLEKKNIKWDGNFKNLFLKGLNLFMISMVYSIIPLFFLFLGIIFISVLSHGEIMSFFAFRGLILIIFSTVLFLIALYFLPMGICIYAEEKSFKKSFDIKEIIDRIFLIPREYTILYLLMVGLLLTSLVVVTLVLNWVSFLLFSGFLFFYDFLVIINLLVKFYPRKAIEVELPL